MMLRQFYWRLREIWRRQLIKSRAVAASLSGQLYALQLFIRYVAFQSSRTIEYSSARRRRRSVLVISYYSPPYKSVYGTQRITKFIKFLVKNRWQVSLITTTPASAADRDDSAELISDGVHLVRLPPIPLHGKYFGKGIFIPDDFVSWVRPATAAAINVARERDASLIFATAPPYSNLLIGAIAASKLEVPFIPDFRDPWTKIDLGWIIDRPILRQLNSWMESTLLNWSHRIVMTDEKKYINDYFSNSDASVQQKVVSITNGFDEEDFKGLNAVEVRREKFTISYVGSLYNQETFDNIVEPFRIWHSISPTDLLEVDLVYAGAHSNYFEATTAMPVNVLNLGYVTHHEAIRIRMNSDLQLFSQPAFIKPHVYSGKIFEMLRCGVPILAITRTDGSVAELLKRTGGGFCTYQHTEVATVLKNCFERWKRGERLAVGNATVISEFAREELARKLIDVFEKTIEPLKIDHPRDDNETVSE